MSLFSKLFGGGTQKGAAEEAEEYSGCRIIADPMPEGGKFRLQARIEKDFDGTVKTHILIRADVFDDRSSAADAAKRKARQVIDEQGDRIF